VGRPRRSNVAGGPADATVADVACDRPASLRMTTAYACDMAWLISAAWRRLGAVRFSSAVFPTDSCPVMT
jgi:hypothetical protein